MATAAFKSTTRRAPIGRSSDANESSSSNNSHRRSRSLSRFSRRPPEPESEFGQAPAPRGRFVSTLPGSGFPEISLDDLAIEFFPVKDSADETESERVRSSRRLSEVDHVNAATASSQRRGRSVSRQSSRVGDGKCNFHHASGGVRTASDANSRRRRSVSVLRCQISDSESDIDHSQSSSNHDMKSFNGRNSQMPSSTVSSQRQLGRSVSHKDLSKRREGYSSQSSALIDDEARDGHSTNMVEKTIRTVYAQKKVEHPTGIDLDGGLYEVMLKELRYAVDEIRTKLEQQAVSEKTSLASGECLKSDNSAVPQAVSNIRKNFATKLEQSEKRKQDLLAEVVLEEKRGRELSKIVKELLPDPKGSSCYAIAGKPSRARKRSNDRSRVSKRLTEEAEKYFEDFISNVEDTDISSFDGERSDSSSTLGPMKARGVSCSGETDTFQITVRSDSIPVEIDGVILPWLQWETGTDVSHLPSKNMREPPRTPKNKLWDSAWREISAQDPSSYSASSRGSWSPALDNLSLNNTAGGTESTLRELESHRRSEFDMDKYLKLQKQEDLLFEKWGEQHRINSGGLLLCGSSFII